MVEGIIVLAFIVGVIILLAGKTKSTEGPISDTSSGPASTDTPPTKGPEHSK